MTDEREDIYDTRVKREGYGCPERITRDWLPDRVWRVFCIRPFQLGLWTPFREVLTRKPRPADFEPGGRLEMFADA